MKNMLWSTLVAFVILFASHAKANAGAFVVQNKQNPTVIQCNYGDVNCSFYSPVIFLNVTGFDMYNTKVWTQGRVIEYTNNFGTFTKGMTEFPGLFEPGIGPNILVKVKPDSSMLPGNSYRELIFIDGKNCTEISGTLDCYYYGASTFEVIVKINPVKINILPRPTFKPVPRPRPIPRPVYSK